MKNLTKIASLPGSGTGCMSAMKPEEGVGLAKPTVITIWPTLEAFKATVQMKAPYFEEPKDWTPVYYKADSHDELSFPPIDLGPIGGEG